jgi:predicted nucleic acid-binding protein
MPTAASRRARISAPSIATAIRYVETSAVLAALLEGDAAARRSLRRRGALITSAVTFAEARRGLVRARHDTRLTADQERAALRGMARLRARCIVVAVTEEVLARSGQPFPVEPVRTLDAIHLATVALAADAPELATVITRDARVRANAIALGYAVEW